MTNETFVHLGVHTDHSLVDGILRIKQLVSAVADAGMPAVALTEQSNLYSLVKFYRAAMDAGIKPIIGADVLLRGESDEDMPTRLSLLCQNQAGYLNLSVLLSEAYRVGQRDGRPTVSWDQLRDRADGLIVLAGGVSGAIGQAISSGNLAEAQAVAELSLIHI